jgi:hypothetical protein
MINNTFKHVDNMPKKYQCRGCNNNLASDSPASQYQRQKLIQNTVRVKSSLYTMNLAGLTAYQKPSNQYQIVEQAGTPYYVPPKTYWNQMSDRAKPSRQVAKTASGSTYHTSSTRHTITRDRPGALSPGGIGVDIKHNSYDRYLNKIKGKKPLRRGIVEPNYGQPIVFNPAFPIYGGKVVKTNIVNGCKCPDIDDSKYIYGSESDAIFEQIMSIRYKFNVGDYVWAKKMDDTNTFYKALITGINDGLYEIKFEDDDTMLLVSEQHIFIYNDCDCNINYPIRESLLASTQNQRNVDINDTDESINLYCALLNGLSSRGII